MNYEQMIQAMTPEIYHSLKTAVELGKWPNGVRLTHEQRETCMRALVAYDYSKKGTEERVGYIDRTRPDGNQHGKDPLSPDVIKILADNDD